MFWLVQSFTSLAQAYVAVNEIAVCRSSAIMGHIEEIMGHIEDGKSRELGCGVGFRGECRAISRKEQNCSSQIHEMLAAGGRS